MILIMYSVDVLKKEIIHLFWDGWSTIFVTDEHDYWVCRSNLESYVCTLLLFITFSLLN